MVSDNPPTITYLTSFSSSSLKNSLKSLGRVVVIVELPQLFDGRQPLCWRLRLPVRPVVGLIGQRGHRKGRSIQRRGIVHHSRLPSHDSKSNYTPIQPLRKQMAPLSLYNGEADVRSE